MKTTITPKQSAELIKRGVSADKASMFCIDFNGTYAYVSGDEVQTVRVCVNSHFYVEESRVFTLADLLSLLPNNYPGDELNSGDKRVYLTITAVDWDRWMAKYSTVHKVIAARIHDEMIDAVYELLLWAIDHNHVKLG